MRSDSPLARQEYMYTGVAPLAAVCVSLGHGNAGLQHNLDADTWWLNSNDSEDGMAI